MLDTNHKRLLEAVTNGFKVEFSPPPRKFKPQKSLTLGKMQENLCDQEVRALLEKMPSGFQQQAIMLVRSLSFPKNLEDSGP
jgi:hypothetical protein